MIETPFIFFDLGQTLVDEWRFIEYLDNKLLEVLNGFGARIDLRNYRAVRDNVIRNRMIGNGSTRELIIEICRLVTQHGYERIIADRLEYDIKYGRRELFRFYYDAEQTLSILSQKYKLGIIANQSRDVLQLLDKFNFRDFFNVVIISSEVNMNKPDPRIFQLAMDRVAKSSKRYVMIGDRLDTDISPANKLGMKTIRYTNSLFRLQEPIDESEMATHVVNRLSEIPGILQEI
ncbi:MAG: HAD family hydrolase [Nitrosopumilales archaeon]|jgi:HAD superfamily hydrolase (TIGR01549 family)|nr:MAG: HAD family hydrolase [Nitrosopumilales archaeon]